MRKLEFEYHNQIKRLELSKLNIFVGGSQTGKTELLEVLNSVFLGQDSKATYDMQPISKNQFNVKIVNASQTVDDELKMTSKTELLTMTKQVIQNLSEEIVDEVLKNIKSSLNPVEQEMHKVVNISGNDGFEINSLMDLIKDYYRFIDTKEYSQAMKKYALYYSLIPQITKKNTILLLDDFDAYLDLSQMLKIVEVLLLNENLTIFLFAKSSELCRIYFEKYCVFVMNFRLKPLKTIIEDFTGFSITSTSKKQLSFLLVTEDEIKENFTNLVRMYFTDFFHLIINENRLFLIENFKKMKYMSKNDIKIIENFKKYLEGYK